MEEEVQHCKNCKRDISAKNFVIHSAHCERKIQLCNRCSEPVPRSELEKHEEEFHSQEPCSYCGISVEKWQIEKHKETCVKKLVPCEYCELEVPLDSLSEHSIACGSRTEQCPKCKKHVMIKNIEKHPTTCFRRETGVKKLQSCEYCDLECSSDYFFEHVAACRSRTKECPKCQKPVMIKDLEKHPLNCLREPDTISCEYCDKKIDLSEFEMHTAICGTRTERCFLCNEHVMVLERDIHFADCQKTQDFNDSISCDYCGGSFSQNTIRRHVELCKSQAEKCDRCNTYIQRIDMKLHLSMCKQEKQLRLNFPCKYCGNSFPREYLKDHATICETRTQKCEKCDRYIELKNMKTHSDICQKKQQLSLNFPCNYCGNSFPREYLKDHATGCESRTQKCEKCGIYIEWKNIKTHSYVCQEISAASKDGIPCKYCEDLFSYNTWKHHIAVCKLRTEKCGKCGKLIQLNEMEEHQCVSEKHISKSHGNCIVCHESVPWIEMNVHTAMCAQIHYETDEYERQNQLNEDALKKESEALIDKSSEEKKAQLNQEAKSCSFCFKKFTYRHFAQHLEVCIERPYNCEKCLKAMPIRNKEEHVNSCRGRQTERHYANAYMLPDEETDDNKELKRLKKCQFCNKKLPDVLFQHHMEECEHREEKCFHCEENVPFKDMQEHKLLKCNFARIAEQRSFNSRNSVHSETIPEPSKNFGSMRHLEEFVERCPSCECKIPAERYHNHLHPCFEGRTRCNFCGREMPKASMHYHFQSCPKILEMVKEETNSQRKKKMGDKSERKSMGQMLVDGFTALISNKGKKIDRNNTTEACKESYSSWQSDKRQNYERGNMTSIQPPTTVSNAVNELPCEFCNELWPFELIIEHQSGCRPDLVSFPKTHEKSEDEKFATAAKPVSQTSHIPVLGASPTNSEEKEDEWKVMSRRNKPASNRDNIDYRIKERNVFQKQQLSAKQKFFHYPPQDSDNVPKNHSSSSNKKRYPQVKKRPENSKKQCTQLRKSSEISTEQQPKCREISDMSETRPDKEISACWRVINNDPKKDKFTSYKFNSAECNEESQNDSNSWKENDGASSIDVKIYDGTKKNNSYNLSKEFYSGLDCVKPNFDSEKKAIGAERTEKKRREHSNQDVGTDLSLVNKDFEEMSLQKSMTFDENNKRNETSQLFETVESSALNLNMPAIWNTEYNFDDKSRDDTLSNAIENIEYRTLKSNIQDTDYDEKNDETFGSDFVLSVNNNQTKEEEIDTLSNSDDTFYDADDGGSKFVDSLNDNIHCSSNRPEEKLNPFDFDNLNLNRENLNHRNYGDLNVNIRPEEEDLNSKDSDYEAYYQFLFKDIMQTDEALSKRTDGSCKCGNNECCCETTIQKTSLKTCSLKDASSSTSYSEPMDMEHCVAGTKTSSKLKSKKSSLEVSSKKNIDDENFVNDEVLKWKKWRASQASDSE